MAASSSDLRAAWTSPSPEELEHDTFGICLEGKTHNVPKARLAAESDYFKRVMSNHLFHEGRDGFVTLEDDDVDAVECMLEFLAMDPDGPNLPDYKVDEAYGSWKSLDCAMMHVRVFNIADQYLMPNLQARAVERFRRTTVASTRPSSQRQFAPFHEWCNADQESLINYVYAGARAVSDDLRDELVAIIHKMFSLVPAIGTFAYRQSYRLELEMHRQLFAMRDGHIPPTVKLHDHFTKYEKNIRWRKLDPQHEHRTLQDFILAHQEQCKDEATKTPLRHGPYGKNADLDPECDQEQFVLLGLLELYHKALLRRSIDLHRHISEDEDDRRFRDYARASVELSEQIRDIDASHGFDASHASVKRAKELYQLLKTPSEALSRELGLRVVEAKELAYPEEPEPMENITEYVSKANKDARRGMQTLGIAQYLSAVTDAKVRYYHSMARNCSSIEQGSDVDRDIKNALMCHQEALERLFEVELLHKSLPMVYQQQDEVWRQTYSSFRYDVPRLLEWTRQGGQSRCQWSFQGSKQRLEDSKDELARAFEEARSPVPLWRRL